MASKSAVYQNKNMSEGKCRYCTDKPNKDSDVCEYHRKKRIEYSKNARARWYKNGLCMHCGKYPYKKDRKQCILCLEKARDREKLRRCNP